MRTSATEPGYSSADVARLELGDGDDVAGRQRPDVEQDAARDDRAGLLDPAVREPPYDDIESAGNPL